MRGASGLPLDLHLGFGYGRPAQEGGRLPKVAASSSGTVPRKRRSVFLCPNASFKCTRAMVAAPLLPFSPDAGFSSAVDPTLSQCGQTGPRTAKSDRTGPEPTMCRPSPASESERTVATGRIPRPHRISDQTQSRQKSPRLGRTKPTAAKTKTAGHPPCQRIPNHRPENQVSEHRAGSA